MLTHPSVASTLRVACSKHAANAARAVFASALLLAALPSSKAAAQSLAAPNPAFQNATPVKSKNIGIRRDNATRLPRSESDQALVDGWPLYRTERGQASFNDAMATLRATDGRAPGPEAFKGCAGLQCQLTLPIVGNDGWIPAGRIWVSPTEYVLFVHSPRNADGRSYRRRTIMNMQVFVFHEFHNSSRNTDTFDTISSHSGGVFVPLYMSKQATDAQGRQFVMVVQVAPHDVVSVHASNHGSAGPGVEVAKNASDPLEPLQAQAGILVATMLKAAVPRMQVVNHRGTEGLGLLNAYTRRLAALRGQPEGPGVTLPFVPAPPQRVTTVAARLDDLILRRGASPRIPVAERSFVPPTQASFAPTSAGMPQLIELPRPVPRPNSVAEPDISSPARPFRRRTL